MRREEALNKAIGILTYHQVNFCKSKEAFANMNEIIETLEKIDQEQCGDCVSREAVENAIKHAEVNFTVNSDIDFTKHKREVQEIVNGIIDAQIKALRDLPSVTPQPKTGRLILLDECSNSGYYCSECQKKVVKEGWSNTVKKIKYCPNCGANMSEIPTGVEVRENE